MNTANITAVIDRYLASNAARTVAANLIVSLKTAETLLVTKELTADTREGILRMVIGLFLDLPANPFWVEHGAYISAVTGSAVNAWLDAPSYGARIGKDGIDETTAEAAVRMAGLRGSLAEIALACLYCEQGIKGLRDKSLAFRDDLLKELEQ